MKNETINEVVRAAPPVGVGGLTLWGWPINEVLIVITIIYTLFLIIDKFPTVVRRVKQLVDLVKGKKHEQSE
jgi:cytochrome c-type biogenesis protein CcmH/NrfF